MRTVDSSGVKTVSKAVRSGTDVTKAATETTTSVQETEAVVSAGGKSGEGSSFLRSAKAASKESEAATKLTISSEVLTKISSLNSRLKTLRQLGLRAQGTAGSEALSKVESLSSEVKALQDDIAKGATEEAELTGKLKALDELSVDLEKATVDAEKFAGVAEHIRL